MTSSEVKQTCFVYGSMDPFNRSLYGVTFPAGLWELILRDAFAQCIDAVAWPAGLELLSLPGYNHSTNNVKWPPRLKTLEFIDPYELDRRESATPMHWIQYDGRFNQPLGSFLPTSLETLWHSDIFDQPLRGVAWPSGLTVLGLGERVSTESFTGVTQSIWTPFAALWRTCVYKLGQFFKLSLVKVAVPDRRQGKGRLKFTIPAVNRSVKVAFLSVARTSGDVLVVVATVVEGLS